MSQIKIKINHLLAEEEKDYILFARRTGHPEFPSNMYQKDELYKHLKSFHDRLIEDVLFQIRLSEM